MSEIRCQMCGKNNPDHLVECKHCGARLKPLIAPITPPEETGTNQPQQSAQDDALGWLRSLGQEGEQEESQDEKWGSTGDLPDWLGGASEEEEVEVSTEADWINDVRGPLDTDDFQEPDEWEASGSETLFNQWLPGEEQTSSEPEKDELDDFFASRSPAPEEDALPSWFSDESRGGSPDQAETFPEEAEDSPHEKDDWLNSLGIEDSHTATVDIPSWSQQSQAYTTEEADKELPDWLTSSDPLADVPDTANDFFDDDLPSWLKSDHSSDFDQLSSDSPSDSQLDGEFPDWLETLNNKTGMTGKLGTMPEWLDNDENKAPSVQGASSEAQLDWLASLGDTPEENQATSGWEPGRSGVGALGGLTLDPEDSFISEVNEDQTPDWLEDLKSPETDYLETPEELPDYQPSAWGFDSPTSQQNLEEAQPVEQEFSSELDAEESETAGGLPKWVQAFHPMEGADIATEYTEGDLERVGPLAGLRGLLTPEAEIAKTAKPPAYSAGLQISSNQESNAQLFQSLVEAENIPTQIPERTLLSSQRVFRLVVGVVLILAMLFPLINGTQIIPLSEQPQPQEIQEIKNLTLTAPINQPVLVAFDYEIGMSGELEAAAVAIFDELMGRGVPLAIVSTSPIGTGLGERMVSSIQQKFPYDHHYVYGEDYVNLGYIAGGTAGLANFATTPRQSLVMAYDNRPIWQWFDTNAGNPWLSPVMANITLLEDFPMTLILTDNPETARNWVEQVAPSLRANSLVMVVSAQIEPFVRPYFENPDTSARQVAGLLVGLRGGTSYEQLQDIFGPSKLFRDAYGVGLLLAVMLILLGGGYYYLDEMNKARRQARRGKSRKQP